MEHYVTIFDGLFLPQGIALHRSLERHAGEFTLWVLCVDEVAATVLRKLDLPNLRIVPVAEVETEVLRALKRERTRAEYCWTLTPQAPAAIFSRAPDAARVTYLDADFWFRKSPAPIFMELEQSGMGVLITDHSYAPDYDQTATSGQYCVQFVTFCRGAGDDVLSWWQERCIEWCYARFEDGKFGDQKYLDDWPRRFSKSVHVLRQGEWILAPWNAIRYPYGSAIAFHFHGLRLLARGRVLLFRGYDIPQSTQSAVYGAYLDDLAAAVDLLGKAGHLAAAQGRAPGVFTHIAILGRKILRTLARLRPVAVKRLPVRSSL